MNSKTNNALSKTAFITLLLIALFMASNHIAARIAFSNGLDVPTAVTARSLATAIIVTILMYVQRVPIRFSSRHRKVLPAVAALICIQSLALYSAVARLPVSLALLAFNTYPLWAALWAKLFYKQNPERAVLLAMPFMLVGLCLALDVFGSASGIAASAHWAIIGLGVFFALIAASTFGGVLVLIQHEVHDLDGRLRTASTFWMVALLAAIGTQTTGEFHWPINSAGWMGLAALTFFYGTGITLIFTALPKLGAVGNSAIMNAEPIFALVLAWLILGQSIALIQVIGAIIVVGTVIKLGLRKSKA